MNTLLIVLMLSLTASACKQTNNAGDPDSTQNAPNEIDQADWYEKVFNERARLQTYLADPTEKNTLKAVKAIKRINRLARKKTVNNAQAYCSKTVFQALNAASKKNAGSIITNVHELHKRKKIKTISKKFIIESLKNAKAYRAYFL